MYIFVFIIVLITGIVLFNILRKKPWEDKVEDDISNVLQEDYSVRLLRLIDETGIDIGDVQKAFEEATQSGNIALALQWKIMTETLKSNIDALEYEYKSSLK